jgi:signal transduction histidine kinase
MVKALKATHGDAPIKRLVAIRQLAFVDAREMLNSCMVDGMPDAARFKDQLASPIVESLAASTGRPLRIVGEIADLLWRDANPQAALRVEELWNELMDAYPISLLCAHDMRRFDNVSAERLVDVCHLHGREIDQRKALEAALKLALSERRKLEREGAELQTQIASAREELRQLRESRDRLLEGLAEGAHDMRTPVNVIMGWTHMASTAGPESPTIREAISVIDRNAETLSRLIDSLLEPSIRPAAAEQ